MNNGQNVSITHSVHIQIITIDTMLKKGLLLNNGLENVTCKQGLIQNNIGPNFYAGMNFVTC